MEYVTHSRLLSGNIDPFEREMMTIKVVRSRYRSVITQTTKIKDRQVR